MTAPLPGRVSCVGIVGAGVMGRGIAQVAAEGGLTVVLVDAEPQAVVQAIDACAAMIRRKIAKGQLDAVSAEAAIARIRPAAAAPKAVYSALEDCDLVIEAVTERMEVKHGVLAGIEAVVRDDCIIATNTSSLSVTGFAARARRPERVAGFHFFNPVPLMRIVEVIGGLLTEESVLESLVCVAHQIGHHSVRVADSPGFLVNHAGRGYPTEALRIVSEGIATFADIDRIMTEGAGFRMGPFELLDLIGLDVSHAVMESIYHQHYEEPRFRPVVLTSARRQAGLLGRKSGKGFYAYAEGKAVIPPEAAVPRLDVRALKIWMGRDEEARMEVGEIVTASGATWEVAGRPSSAAIAVLAPIGEDATCAALAQGLDPSRTVAIDPLTLGPRRTLMRTPLTAPEVLAGAHALFAADGSCVTVIRDSPGFVAQRIMAVIVNIGCEIAQQRIARPEDIDRGVELGLGYPRGPLRLGDHIGPRRVLGVLDGLYRFYGDPRYRPSPWLKRRALLGVSLRHAD